MLLRSTQLRLYIIRFHLPWCHPVLHGEGRSGPGRLSHAPYDGYDTEGTLRNVRTTGALTDDK